MEYNSRTTRYSTINHNSSPVVKEEFKNMSAGLSSVANQPQRNLMMDAIVTSKRQEDQKFQIENRIAKLKKEEERANKRIRDLQRRQKFMKDVNDFKATHYGDLHNLREEKQTTEVTNRYRFNEGRVHS